MLYFPLCEWNWPAWIPKIGGDHFVFFQPIFNVADASLSVSVFVLILFYARYLATVKEDIADQDSPADENHPEEEQPIKETEEE